MIVGVPADIFLVSKQLSGFPRVSFLVPNNCRDSRGNFSCPLIIVGTLADVFRVFPHLWAPTNLVFFCWVCLVSALKNYNDVAVDCQRRLFHVLAIGIKKLLSGSFSLITESRFRTAIIKILFLYPMKKSNTSCAVRIRKNMVRG